MRTPTLLTLLLTACLPAETGIDRTVLTGTLVIPPVLVSDGRTNDQVATAQGLGPDQGVGLTYRSVVIDGAVSDWPSGFGNAEGDVDNYAFAPAADGTFTFTLTFATETLPVDTGSGDSGSGDTADTAAEPEVTLDADVIALALVDPATYDAETGAGVLWSGSSDGTAGVFTAEYEVTGGTTYVLQVLPSASDAPSEELPYTLVVSGSTPTDTTVLVGAYPSADPAVVENPLGGTNAVDWAYDPASYTWTGTFRMMWFRSVEAVADEDTGDLFEPSPIVKEGPASVFVRAGTLSSLNAGLAAGALYTSASVEVAIDNTEKAVPDALVLDGVAPKVIGVQIAEVLPDTTVANVDEATTVLDSATLVAQDAGMLTGLGYVDIFTGSSVLDPARVGWGGGNDSDAFAFTVPESMRVRMSVAWPDKTADIDIGIFYADPDYGVIDLFGSFGDSYCMTGDNPEVCESVVTLEPEVTYYVVPLGYSGTDEQPYTIELEWLTP